MLHRFLAITLCWVTSAAIAQSADIAAAEATIQKNKCGKCHSVDKKKDGPSFKETAAKYRSKADAQQLLTRHLSTGPTIRIDGIDEQHVVLKTADEAERTNLLRFILSR